MNTEASGSVSGELRDVRYCEVIPVTRRGVKLTSWVYNTLGLNHCPPARWDTLTEEEVNRAYGSISAKLNGPRFWVIDRMIASGSTASGDKFVFGGIEMELRASLETTVGQDTVGDQFYVPSQVPRDTVWIYDAGTLVYELTDPDGQVYVMQSYCRIEDRTLTIEQLPALGRKLTLPAGWIYASRALAAELQLVSDGTAYVINDDLYNSYQRQT